MKTYLSFTFYFLLLLSACQHEKPTTTPNNPIPINPTKLEITSGPLDDWITIQKIIPLETKPDALVGRISGLAISETGILITDPRNNLVMIYHPDGSFRSKIQKQGKGPGEYSMITGQDWIESQNSNSSENNDNEVVISDIYGKKLIFYTADGKYIGEAKGPTFLHTIGSLSANHIACHTGRFNNSAKTENIQSQLIVLNRDGELVKSYFPYDIPLTYEMGIGISQGINGGLSYFKMMDPTIYQINSDLTSGISWKFDFGNLAPDTIQLFKPGTQGQQKLQQMSKSNPFIDIAQIHQTNNTLMIGTYYKRFGYKIFLNNNSHNMLTMIRDSTGHIGSYKSLPVKPAQSSYQESFIYSTPAIDWLETIAKLNNDQRKKLRKQIPGFKEAESLTEQDNPILIYYKFKDF
ncbi:MAG: 6-bladed beta-propeller [Bacteroidota bacterium]|nr:6-bladed beta-propeller [Bacteroidota bacterium]